MGVLGDWQDPYLTMNFSFEANIVRTLGKIVDNGHLQQGFKPVHWCLDCGSALAEAEVEYQDKVSSAVDVAFPFADQDEAQRLFEVSDVGLISVAIWTTTPWTLAANRGVSIAADLDYVLVKVGARAVLVAEALADACADRFGEASTVILARVKGAALDRVTVTPPFSATPVPLMLGDHVTTDAGTGCVHTAPAHGLEDFQIGKSYDLEVYNPVGGNGVYLPGTPVFEGKHIFKANDDIIAELASRDALLCHKPFNHSYPHCCRTPFKFIGLLLTPLLAERESQLDLVGALMCIFESGVRVAKAY